MKPTLRLPTCRPLAGFAVAALILSAACAPGGGTPAPAPAPAPTAVPPAIHWYRTSAEQRALYLQAYGAATAHVREAAEHHAGEAWGVILDADETVLDNSTYQLRRARLGLGYSPESWNEWVREEAAPALPGAADFIREVHRLGGRVAIVTNRDEVVCGETRSNLAAVGVEADVVLCRQPGPSGKEGRFRAVQEGTTPAGLPPLRVVAWVGDNIQDFPGGTQALRDGPADGLAEVGRHWFVLPNPMYGSWESNPER